MNWELGIGYWVLGIGYWVLGIVNCELFVPYFVVIENRIIRGTAESPERNPIS